MSAAVPDPDPGDAALLGQLVDRLSAERALFERVLLRLPEVIAGLDHLRVRTGMTELARELCEGDFAVLVAADEDEETGTWSGIVPAEAPRVWRAPLLAAAFRSTTVLRIDDVGHWARSEQAAAAYGTLPNGGMVRSYLVAPVVERGGETIAALFVGHRRAHAFGQHHERLLEAMAGFLASALENAERYHERARVANALQETLLPPLLPIVPGVDIAARYRAAMSESLVGGDFYDVFRAGGDRWAAVVGDVCGTGPLAAGVTGIARYTIRALAETSPSPAATLEALNSALVVQRADRRFLTAAHVTFTPRPEGEGGGVAVQLARAGHPPPVVVRADGDTEVLESPRGMLLGVFDDIDVEDGSLVLEAGDALVLYTDGVVEARDAGKDQWGFDRLQELLSSCAGRTADGIARRLELAVSDFAGGGVTDDIAILVLRAT